MMEVDESHSPTTQYSPPPLSLKQKLKQSLCFSCCFRRRHHTKPPPPPSSDDFKDKCKAILSRVSNHRRHSSTEFRYDPMSYSLNFEDGFSDAQFDEAPLKNFSARLPNSPRKEVGVREIAAVN